MAATVVRFLADIKDVLEASGEGAEPDSAETCLGTVQLAYRTDAKIGRCAVVKTPECWTVHDINGDPLDTLKIRLDRLSTTAGTATQEEGHE